MPLLKVAAVVTDEQERAARRDGLGGGSDDRLPLSGWHLKIEDQHEVKRPRFGAVIEQVGGDPFDGYAARIGELARLLEPDVGEVNPDRLPASL